MGRKIAMEERRLLVAERKLSSIRLLTALFKRVQQVPRPPIRLVQRLNSVCDVFGLCSSHFATSSQSLNSGNFSWIC